MENTTIWSLLASICAADLGQLLAAMGALLAATVGITVKLYRLAEKAHLVKKENAAYRQLVQSHDGAILEIQQALLEIRTFNQQQNEVNLRQIRHAIVRASEEAMADGYISANRLKSLEELFETYEQLLHGNGYVKTIMKKVRLLEVRGLSEE